MAGMLPLLAMLAAAPGASAGVPRPPEAVAAAARDDMRGAFEIAADAAERCHKARRPGDACLDLLLWSAEIAPFDEQARAEALAKAAHAIAERRLPEDHPDRLRAAEARARSIDQKGPDYSQAACGGPCPRRWKEAEPHYRRALALRLRYRAGDHAGLARVRQDLARNLFGQDRRAEAEAEQLLALDSLEAGLPGTAPAFSHALEGLIYDLEERMRYAEAEAIHRRRIAWLQSGAPDVPLVEAVLKLAENLAAQGRMVEAEPEYRRVLDLIGKVPEASDRLPGAYLGLARILEDQGRPAEAEPMLRRAVAIDLATASFGDMESESSRRLAANLERRGLHAEAEQAYRALLDRLDGATPGVRAAHMAMLATAIDAQPGREAEADAMFREALAMARGSDEMLIGLMRGEVARRFALALDRQGRHAEAEPLHREAARFWLEIAPWHVLLAPTLNALAANLEAQGKVEAARAERRRTYAIWAERFPSAHPERIAATADLAAAYLRAPADLAQARMLYREAAGGAIERSRAWRDFGPAASAELLRHRPLFAQGVTVAWALAHGPGGAR